MPIYHYQMLSSKDYRITEYENSFYFNSPIAHILMHKWIVGSSFLTKGGEWEIVYFYDTGKFVYPFQYKPLGLDIVFPLVTSVLL